MMGITYAEEMTQTYTLSCSNCSCEEKLHQEDFPCNHGDWRMIQFSFDSIIFDQRIDQKDEILLCPDCTNRAARIYNRLPEDLRGEKMDVKDQKS